MNESGVCVSARLIGGWSEGIEGEASSDVKSEPLAGYSGSGIQEEVVENVGLS